MHRFPVVLFIVLAALGLLSKSAGSSTPDFSTSIQPFLRKNCLACHNERAKIGGLSLAGYRTTADVIQGRDLWERVSERVKNGEMPPKGMPQPTPAEVNTVTGWINSTFASLDRNTPPDPGRLTAHRLNRFEYDNAVQDLLAVNFKPADDFPNDDSGYGFDNIGDVLSLSPVLMEKYLSAAEKIARKAIPTGALPRPTRDKISNHHVPRYGLAPIGEYIRYNVTNEADYTIRAGVSGKREPLFITLIVDNVAVKDAIFDDSDDEKSRFIEFPTHLTAGEHRIAARLRRTVAVVAMPKPPDLRFVNAKPPVKKEKAEPPPPTPRVDYVELQGPYHPLPAPPTEAQKRIFTCTEKTTACAEDMLRPLAYHAWRRPVKEIEIQKVARFVTMAQASGDTFDEGMRLALEAILVSPDFLFRIERDLNPHDALSAHPVNDFELASRLSFFLWSSIPDAVLLHAAEEHTLHQPRVLKAQTERMLKDERSARFVNSFAGQWLELRNLDSLKPDPDKFPQFEDLRDDMRTETRMFFEAVMREDRSILDFLDGKYTFLNQELAAFYGLSGVQGNEFRRVDLDGVERSGILTQASVLTVSSYPTRTSPVIRGKWVLENLLNTPPPPPPPNVPALLDSEVGTKVSLREQLEKHRANPVCASCHAKMDPLGFGLENYDGIGRWRTVDGKFPIDSSGKLPSGKSFTTPAQIKEILRSNPDAFAQCLSEKMLTYALGRGLERYDRPAVKKLVEQLAANDYRFELLVSGIVESLPFQMRRGEGETHVTQTIAQAHHP